MALDEIFRTGLGQVIFQWSVNQPLGYSPGQKQPALENISPIEFLSYRGVACLLGNLRRYIF